MLIPYLMWNILFVLIVTLAYVFAPTMINENYLNIKSFTLSDYFNCFWGISGGLPASYQLWFLRDLIIICLISPIIYYVMKFGRIFVLLILFKILIFTAGGWFDSVIWFSISAYFSAKSVSFKISRFWALGSIISYVVTLICVMNYDNPILTDLNILFGIISLFYLCSVNKCGGKLKFSQGLFFVYCYHPLPIAALINIVTLAINNSISEYILIALYFLSPLVIALFGLVIYRLIRICSPFMAELLTGGR